MITENSQNTPNLPLEILDRIFGFLDNEQPSWITLKACSAIRDPILRAAIDRRIYTRIELNEWDVFEISHDEIYQYLSKNRHVANYIRTLDITIPRGYVEESSQWYNQVSSILQMPTSSLERITLSYWLHIDATRTDDSGHLVSRTVRFAWSDFPATFRKAFLDCLWSSGIIEASMTRIGGLPLSIFNPCTRLKKLSLLQVICTPSISDAQFPPQIDSLVLSQSEDLATIVSWAKMGHMRYLNFSLHPEADQRVAFGQLTGLLNSYCNDLIDLELDFWYLSASDFDPCKGLLKMDPPFTLDYIQNLTQLTIVVCLRCGYSRSIDSAIPGIVNVVATSPSLKRLILRALVNPRFDVTVVPDFCKSLVSLVDHCSLEHIELQFVSAWKVDIQKIVSDAPEVLQVSKLKMLYNSGFLSVTGREIDFEI